MTSDGTCKVWDCKLGDEIGTFDCKALPQDLHWSANGDLFCCLTKDKMGRFFDPRESRVVAEWMPHDGTKCSKMTWIGQSHRVVTTGFNRGSQREWKMWDLRNLRKPICSDSLDMVGLTEILLILGIRYNSTILRPRYGNPLSGRKG